MESMPQRRTGMQERLDKNDYIEEMSRPTITIDGKTSTQYKTALKQANIATDMYSEAMLNNFNNKDIMSSVVEEVNLVILTPRDLGFTTNDPGATLSEIYKKAELRGLELCPPNVGPQFLLEYPEGIWNHNDFEWGYVAMDPVVMFNDENDVTKGYYYVFNPHMEEDKENEGSFHPVLGGASMGHTDNSPEKFDIDGSKFIFRTKKA